MISNMGDLTGQTLGTCTLTNLLGQGGMGAVYLAQQERPSRNVAVKVLLPNLAMNSQEFLARFRREADLIAKLEHMNIMPIYEYGEKDGIPYLVMPYLTGGSLRDILIQQGALSLAIATSYIEQACSALDYAHSQGVIHRDLKPANFLLHADGRLILADFGIARIVEKSGNTDGTLTMAGTVMGTPEYMAPEMFNGGVVDYRADIYELGVVLFQMLNGRVPFTGSSPFTIANRHMQELLPLLNQSNPMIPPAVDAVIQIATAKRREERYPSAQAMAQALRQAISMPNSNTNLNNRGTTGVPAQQSQLVLPAPMQQYADSPAPQYASHTASYQGNGQNYQSLAPTRHPTQTAYAPTSTPKTSTKKRSPTGLIIGLIILVLIIVGGIFAGIQLTTNSGQNQPTTNTTRGTTTSSSTNNPQATVPAQTVPTVAFPTSAASYTSTEPGCGGKKSGWLASKVTYKCEDGQQTVITNNSTSRLGGLLFTRQTANQLKEAFQVQIQPNTQSNAEFGIIFHASQAGGYTLLIQPDGQWHVYAYDQPGNFRALASGTGALTATNAPVKLGVAIDGSQFSLYANDTLLGNVSDVTYPKGELGLMVGRGGSISVSDFKLYANANTNSQDGGQQNNNG